jgi:serine/threonine protein kinase
LTDFGLAKENMEDDTIAMSFCGSTCYLAPEMIKRTGHSKSMDWYLLGVMIYEMITGIPPYYSNNKDRMMKAILTKPLKLPEYVSPNARSILKMLLVKNPAKRLGSGKFDAEIVKCHPWFKDIDWNEVYSR